ncbi:MAG: type VI secretion system Vgr family protein [Tangfeifania sp.]
MALLSKIDISINQKPLKSFQHISISQSLYGIDQFEITCRYEALEELDGFLIENSKDYLGLPIVIQTKLLVNDQEKDGINFRGFVTEIQSSRSGMSDFDEIIISGGSSEIALNRKPTNRAFIDKTLEEIVREVLKKYELKSTVSPRNSSRFPYIVQFEESDLEFLKRLSVRYGEWTCCNGKEFIFGELPEEEKSLTIGLDLKDFRYGLRVNPVRFNLFTVDPLNLDVHRFQSGKSQVESNLNIYGKHALDRSQKMYTEEGRDYYEHVNVNESDYKKGLDDVGKTQEIVDAVNLTELSGSSVNGFLTSGVRINVNCIKQQGKEKINYGKYLITSIQHEMDNTLFYENSFSAIPAETTLPENTDPYFVKTSPAQLGMVTDNKDPEKLGRVKISFWWMEGRESTPWVKTITPYAGVKNSGFYFIPSVNTRVLVDFEDGDVEKPYCLGMLYDKDNTPEPNWAGNASEEHAKIHAIRTATGNTIEFYDADGEEKITIYDKDDKNRITLDSANNELKIIATESLKIEANDIEIKANNGFKIEAGQGLELKGNKVSAVAQSDLKTTGTNVEIKANAAFKAEGSASAEVSSSGNLTVKGTLVQIN